MKISAENVSKNVYFLDSFARDKIKPPVRAAFSNAYGKFLGGFDRQSIAVVPSFADGAVFFDVLGHRGGVSAGVFDENFVQELVIAFVKVV